MNVEKGMENNQEITFKGEADEAVSIVGWFSTFFYICVPEHM